MPFFVHIGCLLKCSETPYSHTQIMKKTRKKKTIIILAVLLRKVSEPICRCFTVCVKILHLKVWQSTVNSFVTVVSLNEIIEPIVRIEQCLVWLNQWLDHVLLFLLVSLEMSWCDVLLVYLFARIGFENCHHAGILFFVDRVCCQYTWFGTHGRMIHFFSSVVLHDSKPHRSIELNKSFIILFLLS